MDEVLLVIQGFIDRQRIERRNAYLIHESMVGSVSAVNMFERLPLQFDDELREQSPATEMSAEEFYKQAIESGYLNSEWWNN